MTKLFYISATLSSAIAAAACWAADPQFAFKKVRLEDQFYAVGADHAHFNHDGKLDVVAGPSLVRRSGLRRKNTKSARRKASIPTATRRTLRRSRATSTATNWADIFYVPLPGKEGYWYENPAGKDAVWKAAAGLSLRGQRIADVGRCQSGRPAGLGLSYGWATGLRDLTTC